MGQASSAISLSRGCQGRTGRQVMGHWRHRPSRGLRSITAPRPSLMLPPDLRSPRINRAVIPPGMASNRSLATQQFSASRDGTALGRTSRGITRNEGRAEVRPERTCTSCSAVTPTVSVRPSRCSSNRCRKSGLGYRRNPGGSLTACFESMMPCCHSSAGDFGTFVPLPCQVCSEPSWHSGTLHSPSHEPEAARRLAGKRNREDRCCARHAQPTTIALLA